MTESYQANDDDEKPLRNVKPESEIITAVNEEIADWKDKLARSNSYTYGPIKDALESLRMLRDFLLEKRPELGENSFSRLLRERDVACDMAMQLEEENAKLRKCVKQLARFCTGLIVGDRR